MFARQGAGAGSPCYGSPRRGIGPRAATVVTAIVLAVALLTVGPAPIAAQGVMLSTPYPSVSVEPGATANFDLNVHADEPVRVDLSVDGVPEGWTAVVRGGGREVSSVFADPDEPPELSLDLDVPEEAQEGVVTVTVVGRAGTETARLPLDVNVVTAASGSVRLATDVPARAASADESFEFSLELDNDTPQQLTFELQASGPRGWTISVSPSGEEGATSVTVDARGSQTLNVEATPPAQATEGDYPIRVEALAGEHSVAADLVARVTGRLEMDFTTTDQRLNATAQAGSPSDVEVVVINTGTATLTDVSLSGDGPSEWDVSFEPDGVDSLEPGGTQTARAIITPSQNAVAGDYIVELSASGEGLDESIEIRISVETPPVWGAVGLALILLTLGGMVWVFRRYGRR